MMMYSATMYSILISLITYISVGYSDVFGIKV